MDSSNFLRNVIPGEEVARENKGFMAGWGTYVENGVIISSVAGVVHTINKLILVNPKKSSYKPDVGDVVIGRILSVDKKSWRVNITSNRDANLNLTAINLPKGEQRRRSEDDIMQMRAFFEENDLLSGEVQQVHSDGGVNIQTRNLKYGKLKNGVLVEVNPSFVKKMKHHFFDLTNDVKCIIGMNGNIWIYFSTIKLDNDYFSDDQNKLPAITKQESPNEYSTILIILFRNIVKSLENNKIVIDQFSMMKFFEIYLTNIQKLRNNESETEFLKSKIVIQHELEKIVINSLKTAIQSNSKNTNYVDLVKEVENMRNMVDQDEEMEHDN
jgi:exosome complex RNA-binding protein Rrp4